jgi:ATP-dependent helicase/nuclease subunit A
VSYSIENISKGTGTMQLTASQQAALALDKNISVTAGAGSGKTRILVDRFLKIAFGNPALTKQIVAITFTEKAAAEMQERIADEVNKQLQAANLETTDRKKLQIIRDQLNSAHISTIHGFCMRLLQEFPIEANVTPDFTILDPIRQQVLMHKAIQTTLEILDKEAITESEADWFTLFLALPRRRIIDMLKVSLEKPFETMIIARDFSKRSKDEYIQFLTERWLKHFQSIITYESIQQIFLMVKQIIENDNIEIKTEKGQELEQLLQSFYDEYMQNENTVRAKGIFLRVAEAFTKNDGKAYSNLSFLGKKESWGPFVQKTLIQLSDFLEPLQLNIIQMDPGSPPDETDEKWYDLFMTFLKLHQDVFNNFKKVKEEQGVLDFEDLQIRTLDLLKNSEETRQKLHSRFKYIMVDEFQDTNPVQWQIVELLASEKDHLSVDKIFVVGDPKQSIYGFRDADIRIFKDVVNSFASKSGELFSEHYDGNIIFRESFRFLPQINAFINHFFGQILQPDANNPFEVAYENLTAQRNIPEKGLVELVVFDEENPGQSEAEYMALKINELINSQAIIHEDKDGQNKRPVRYGDIAILIRDRSSLSDIEFALRQYNIPFKTVGGIGFWQRQEIYDIYHVLRFLANPADDLALVGILRSRLFLLPDNAVFLMSDNDGIGFMNKLKLLQNDYRLADNDKQQVQNTYTLIEKWLNLRERLNLSELLNIILDDTKLFAQLNAEFSGDQRTANLQKVVELADSFDQSGPGGMKSFLDIIDDLINREVAEGEAFLALDDISSVKIMTIHVSKGLQFPIVFTPYLNRSMRSVGSDIMLDRELGMAVTFKNEEDYYGDRANENTLYRLLRIRQRYKDLAETKRIFYVGVSRASEYLFLSATVKGQKARRDSMFGWLNDCLVGEAKSAYFPGLLQFNDFQIQIINSYEPSQKKDDISAGFKQLLNELAGPQDSIEDNSGLQLVQEIPLVSHSRIFSATALMTFARDPEEYYRHYHLGFFEGDYEQSLLQKSDDLDSLLKGKIVHRFLEIYDGSQAQEIIEKILFDFEIYDKEINSRLKDELISIHLMMSQSGNGKSILAAKEYMNEVPLTMQLDEDFFTGTIDRLQKSDNGNWEVFDYKTNKVSNANFEETAQKYDIQMQSYALLLSRLYPGQKEYRVVLYFLTLDKFFEKTFKKEEIFNIEKYFITLVSDIKTKFPIRLPY